MTSWFSTGIDFTSALDTLTETVQGVTDSVQEAIPQEHKEFLAKLTLNTDEMIAQRETFGNEASRKEQAKDRLNKILPWETLDPEREILVEECKEAILELSGQEDTFFGPYEMPLLNVQLESSPSDDDLEDSTSDPEIVEPEAGNTEGGSQEVPEENAEEASERKARHMAPTQESLERLAQLQPLPSLLEDFDLEIHVGLIQSVMKEDPKLVAMQALYSGGGARERTFWRNYFFHCAFTRYEAGLSLDEIWSYPEESSSGAADQQNAEVAPEETASGAIAASVLQGEEVAADTANATNEAATAPSVQDDIALTEESMINFDDTDSGVRTSESTTLAELSELSPKNGFEMIDEDFIGTGDPELDELEAEIARELEGM